MAIRLLVRLLCCVAKKAVVKGAQVKNQRAAAAAAGAVSVTAASQSAAVKPHPTYPVSASVTPTPELDAVALQADEIKTQPVRPRRRSCRLKYAAHKRSPAAEGLL